MKVCPVCDARAFDDAAICYGCLYRFNEDEGCFEEGQESEARVGDLVGETDRVATKASGGRSGVDARESHLSVDRRGAAPFPAPEFLIRFTPIAGETGVVTWSCAIEPVAC